MKQVVRNKSTKPKVKTSKPTTRNKPLKKQHKHPKFGTSKLEQDFARDFLDKLGLEYQWQFEAKDIGRFYDFLVEKTVIVEIDGDFFHSNPLLYEEKDLNAMQRRNKKIDEYKTNWALMNGFPIIRIWEHDIRKNPKKVLDLLKETFYLNNDEKKEIHKRTVVKIPKKKKIKEKNDL